MEKPSKSSSRRKWKFRIRHILEAMSDIEAFTEGMTLETFLRDAKTMNAVTMKIMVIGEAARMVPAEARERHPGIPWRKLQALRNVIAHEYQRVNFASIWSIAKDDLPPLVPLLKGVLEKEPDE